MSQRLLNIIYIVIWRGVAWLVWSTWNMPDPRHPLPQPAVVKGVPA